LCRDSHGRDLVFQERQDRTHDLLVHIRTLSREHHEPLDYFSADSAILLVLQRLHKPPYPILLPCSS
jgi:hypothetical protein